MDRVGYVVIELDQPLGRGAGVAVDRLIVVAHREDRQRRAGEETQQQHVRRRQVLELVDQQDFAATLGRDTNVGFAEHDLDRTIDLFVEIDLTVIGEVSAVIGEEVGESVEVTLIVPLDQRR